MKKSCRILAAVLAMMLICVCCCADETETRTADETVLTDTGEPGVPAEEETDDTQESGRPRPNSDGVYRVIVTDSDGDPVPEAAVQFCSETACRFGETDGNGIAEFDAEEGIAYSIHIAEVPEGYEEPDEEFMTLEEYCDICIVLLKAAE